jgi:undecaprenyl-diphosphatase
MTIFQAFVLGVVQGLSEFLPISSSGHLFLVRYLLGWPDPGVAFDVALHVGTLVAVVWYFWSDWLALAAATLRVVNQRGARTPLERRAVFLVLATIPGGLAGWTLSSAAETTFRAESLAALALIVFGIILWLVDRFAPRERALEGLRWSDALLIGIAQAFALVPGVSRSGATMTAGRALGFDRQQAAVFSFLMSMPIIAAAALGKGTEALDGGIPLAPLIIGILAAALSGWVAIAGLLRLVATRGYGSFAAYRVVVGLIVLWTIFARG